MSVLCLWQAAKGHWYPRKCQLPPVQATGGSLAHGVDAWCVETVSAGPVGSYLALGEWFNLGEPQFPQQETDLMIVKLELR